MTDAEMNQRIEKNRQVKSGAERRLEKLYQRFLLALTDLAIGLFTPFGSD